MKPYLQVEIQIARQWANIGLNMNIRVSVYNLVWWNYFLQWPILLCIF